MVSRNVFHTVSASLNWNGKSFMRKMPTGIKRKCKKNTRQLTSREEWVQRVQSFTAYAEKSILRRGEVERKVKETLPCLLAL